MTDEDWEEALANCKAVSPKLSDRLSHLYMLHRSYLTPHRISKYRHDHNPNCPNCGHCTASFFHLIWACPSIQGFWTQVVKFLHDRMGSPISLCPRQGLLGLLSLSESEKYLNTFFTRNTIPCQATDCQNMAKGGSSHLTTVDQSS